MTDTQYTVHVTEEGAPTWDVGVIALENLRREVRTMQDVGRVIQALEEIGDGTR